MTSSTTLVVTTNQNESNDDFIDAFSDIEHADPFELKKDTLATQLAALMSFCEKSRSEIAEDLGWKKSRVTRVLSGNENLTIKSIWEFSSCLGFDFDVAFHRPDEQRPKQPWQTSKAVSMFIPMVTWQSQPKHLPWRASAEIQSAHDVFIDLIHGDGKDYYVSLVSKEIKPSYLTNMAAQITDLIPTNLTIPVMRNIRSENDKTT